ncbi:MAG: helix-turn-helix domain-containing protein [Bifidobacteriaceae bacterium]|jgi:DNA-binding XRE family transcriptional regulator|nr:helix-turn-helix domain-containing protein [Bifidobacteriaceae bacterium]
MSRISDLIARKGAEDPALAQAFAQEREGLEVAVALAKLREDMGLTQRALAERSGRPQSTIARIENGSMNASVALLGEIASSVGKRVELRFVDA